MLSPGDRPLELQRAAGFALQAVYERRQSASLVHLLQEHQRYRQCFAKHQPRSAAGAESRQPSPGKGNQRPGSPERIRAQRRLPTTVRAQPEVPQSWTCELCSWRMASWHDFALSGRTATRVLLHSRHSRMAEFDQVQPCSICQHQEPDLSPWMEEHKSFQHHSTAAIRPLIVSSTAQIPVLRWPIRAEQRSLRLSIRSRQSMLCPPARPSHIPLATRQE